MDVDVIHDFSLEGACAKMVNNLTGRRLSVEILYREARVIWRELECVYHRFMQAGTLCAKSARMARTEAACMSSKGI